MPRGGSCLGLATFEVGAGPRLPAALDDGDLVQRGVQLAVAVVAALLTRRRVDGRHPGEPRELSLVANRNQTRAWNYPQMGGLFGMGAAGFEPATSRV